MSTIDKQRIGAVRTMEALGYAFDGIEWKSPSGPVQLPSLHDEADAMHSLLVLRADKLGGDALFGSDSSFHGTLFSTFSQTDATHRVLLAWAALGAIIIVLTIVICIGLKRKDVRV